MGCGSSKDQTKGKKRGSNAAATNNNNVSSNVESEAAHGQPQQANNQVPDTARSVDAPVGRATNPNDVNIMNQDVASSTAAPSKNGPRRAAGDAASAKNDVDENGNPVVLPKGDWVKTEGTPYYYSATENLYYHPPSWQFYDPTNEMWYDPEKNEWYRDDADDVADEAAAAGV